MRVDSALDMATNQGASAGREDVVSSVWSFIPAPLVALLLSLMCRAWGTGHELPR